MLNYRVDDLRCGHCADTITQAVLAVDPQASVTIDRDRKQVRVDAVTATAERVREAIVAAGYGAVAIAPPSLAATSPRASPCCGCCG